MSEYKPYPKWLHFEGEPSVLVQDEAEHEAVIAARKVAPEPAPVAVSRKGVRKAEPPVFELDSLPAPE